MANIGPTVAGSYVFKPQRRKKAKPAQNKDS